MGLNGALPLKITVELGVIATKEFSMLFGTPKQDPYHWMQCCVILRIFFEDGIFPPRRESSQRVVSPVDQNESIFGWGLTHLQGIESAYWKPRR